MRFLFFDVDGLIVFVDGEPGGAGCKASVGFFAPLHGGSGVVAAHLGYKRQGSLPGIAVLQGYLVFVQGADVVYFTQNAEELNALSISSIVTF